MPLVRKTRQYEFPAAHVLASPQLSAAENDRIFGKCANPNGHGHDYGVWITVEGGIDPETGEVVQSVVLDELFEEAVGAKYSHRMLNEISPFETEVPTAENIAKAIFLQLVDPVALRTRARLAAVRVIETANNHFDVSD